MKKTIKIFFVPAVWGLGGATRRAAMTLLAVMLASMTAFANFGWYDGSITIGGVTTNFITGWSTSSDSPTDLGNLTDMTVTSVAFNVWSDSNDRDGANMIFRIWDGGSTQVGSDQDLWLGAATRIQGEHDFAISWTGSFNLASAVGLTLEAGKTYYIDMWAKTYGVNGDQWYNGVGDNYHAKLKYAPPPHRDVQLQRRQCRRRTERELRTDGHRAYCSDTRWMHLCRLDAQRCRL